MAGEPAASRSCQRTFGKAYYYLVAPGVAFHELGHALGCVITFTRITKVVLFHPQGDTLGYVSHIQPARFVALREFIIATGPVWMGCGAIALLGCFLGESDFLPDYSKTFPDGEPGMVSYVSTMFLSSWGMFKSLVTTWNWTSPVYLVLLYLLFCITSEITLSPPDISGIWGGIVGLILIVLIFNLIPGVNAVASATANWLKPYVFTIHASMLFVLLIDIVFYFLFKLIMKVFGR